MTDADHDDRGMRRTKKIVAGALTGRQSRRHTAAKT